ncbi:MAG TPA: hypothetical protein VMG99_07245 [Thermoplasmata archaeon]|nr:hypothetical protein [Thermoplasmata archaeon]
MPPRANSAVRWFQTVRGVSLLVKLLALGILGLLVAKVLVGGGL